jgi:hypothetical protein
MRYDSPSHFFLFVALERLIIKIVIYSVVYMFVERKLDGKEPSRTSDPERSTG